ncbi:Uncharacterised protein [Mycobacteroides abscessus subsp. massiliense]|nr:hypothetical protein DDT49_19735 [Mycobacteroides abscessus]SKK72040.1 Uncharacterised protein [Mycobacteroides abscessus subsp. massiliense]PVB05520.1 hypothetical protein DDJ51_00135 [Mycobacteroides abscessus]PVB30182.1 hypothetical protein DDJ92_12225 [Mycobacteroides abscessus]SKL19246.1 Uncharacterised protein [Mycobacteroides abscessus subsp. massiliense]
MGFQRERVVELVTEFYRDHGADEGTELLVASNLDDAIGLAVVRGVDARFSEKFFRLAPTAAQDLGGVLHVAGGMHDLVFDHVVRQESERSRFRTGAVLVASADAAAALPDSLRVAVRCGLGWLIAAERTAILVPSPVMRVTEGRPDVLHDDTGRMAVVWLDGTGYYFLHGLHFGKRLYFQVIDHQLLIQDIAALGNADQRAIALQYMTFEQLVEDSDAQLLDKGVRGTSLYRLKLPPRLADDRKPGHGGYDYFIHMRDASHPEREFIEWVDPDIGKQRHAELCQAWAFGVSLDEWLSIEQEG